jgi:hypothetical protein
VTDVSARKAVVEAYVDGFRRGDSAAILSCLTEDVVPRQVDPAPVLRVDEGELHLVLWVVRSWNGEPRNLQPHEHDELRWVPAGEVGRLRLAHPSYVDVARRAVTGAA